MNRAKLQRAARAVTEGGLTVAKAAETHSVDFDRLKEMLAGRRSKHRGGVADTQRTLTKRYKGLASSNGNMLRRLLEQHEDGDVTERQVNGIFDHLESLQQRGVRSVADWRRRFSGMTGKK